MPKMVGLSFWATRLHVIKKKMEERQTFGVPNIPNGLRNFLVF